MEVAAWIGNIVDVLDEEKRKEVLEEYFRWADCYEDYVAGRMEDKGVILKGEEGVEEIRKIWETVKETMIKGRKETTIVVKGIVKVGDFERHANIEVSIEPIFEQEDAGNVEIGFIPEVKKVEFI